MMNPKERCSTNIRFILAGTVVVLRRRHRSFTGSGLETYLLARRATCTIIGLLIAHGFCGARRPPALVTMNLKRCVQIIQFIVHVHPIVNFD
jgi:hypothetical protein